MVNKKKTKTKIKDTSVPSGVQNVFDEYRNKIAYANFLESKTILTKWGIFFGFLLLLILYLILPGSRVKSIRISGNSHLSQSYIEDLSGIHTNDIFYFQIPFLAESAILNDPLVESVSVSWADNNVIQIEVEEKRIVGYRYNESAEILLADGTIAELKSEYLTVIADVPLITGFTEDEQVRLLCKALNTVKTSMIANISEISQYSTGYDDEVMKILMRNGGYYIGTYRNLSKLNSYYAIYNDLRDKSYCIIGDDTNENAYGTVCPWNKDTSSIEYWTDDNGNIIQNQYGDDVEKRYYKDESGNDALDANGNRIPIPIDENGNQIADEDFIDHYNQGYYASGKLELPE